MKGKATIVCLGWDVLTYGANNSGMSLIKKRCQKTSTSWDESWRSKVHLLPCEEHVTEYGNI